MLLAFRIWQSEPERGSQNSREGDGRQQCLGVRDRETSLRPTVSMRGLGSRNYGAGKYPRISWPASWASHKKLDTANTDVTEEVGECLRAPPPRDLDLQSPCGQQ